MNRNLLVALVVLAVACGMPRDPRRTLEHVRGATLRVGVGDDSGAEGREGALIRGFAASLGAKVEWIRGPQEAQLDALHEGELDLVAGRLTSDSPWKKKVALTKPYAEEGKKKYVFAVAPGENAFLLELERYLEPRR